MRRCIFVLSSLYRFYFEITANGQLLTVKSINDVK